MSNRSFSIKVIVDGTVYNTTLYNIHDDALEVAIDLDFSRARQDPNDHTGNSQSRIVGVAPAIVTATVIYPEELPFNSGPNPNFERPALCINPTIDEVQSTNAEDHDSKEPDSGNDNVPDQIAADNDNYESDNYESDGYESAEEPSNGMSLFDDSPPPNLPVHTQMETDFNWNRHLLDHPLYKERVDNRKHDLEMYIEICVELESFLYEKYLSGHRTSDLIEIRKIFYLTNLQFCVNFPQNLFDEFILMFDDDISNLPDSVKDNRKILREIIISLRSHDLDDILNVYT
jgi:hypothetical protein